MKKRTESEIMKDINHAYCGLSPENLSCDGELSMFQTRKRERFLTKRLDELFKEIGRKVPDPEAFDIENQ